MSRSSKTLITLLSAAVGALLQTHAATFNVTNTADDGPGSLRQAISDANATAGADTVTFDAGVFSVPQTITLASPLTINAADDSPLSIAGPGANLLTVSGGNAVQVFFINSGDAASISGLTIAAGGNVDASSGTFTAIGGGIFNDGTTTLTNVVITGCAAAFSGGGIYNDSGATMNIIDSLLSNNNAQSRSTLDINGGGAIANLGTVLISGSTISGNTSGAAGDTTTRGDGGAILNDQLLTITNSTITGNSAEENGGAIRNQSAVSGVSLTITGSTISDNTAEKGSGGGIQLVAGSTTAISHSTINGNRALGTTPSTGFGGGILAGGTLELINSTVSGNTAQRDFGGVYVVQASAAVPLSGSTVVTVTGSTIAANTASRNGGGIGTFSPGNQKLNLRNTIVADNSATTGTSEDVNGPISSQGNNLIENTTGATITGTTASNITGQDPLLGPLQNNGGATQTHALLTGSPAIDKGASGTLTTDGRNAPRPFNDPAIANASDGADIGPFELQPQTFQFSAPIYYSSESSTTATITVSRIGDSAGAVSIQYATSDGTATGAASCGAAGADFQNAAGTLNFAAGVTSQTFTITLCDDTALEASETVNLTLSAAGGAAPRPAVLSILDNDAPTPVSPPPPVPDISFVEQQRLGGLEEGNELGFRVAISGDTAVVGVNYEAFVFVRSGDCWALQQKLTPSDGDGGLRFSSSVAISGDTIIVGARGFTVNQGKAYVFVRDGGGVWTEQQILQASDGAFADFAAFGQSVAIEGDTAVVGAPGIGSETTDTQQGAVYVFVRNGATWTEQRKLTASDRARGDLFGVTVALSGETLIVGAPTDDIGTNADQGSAYVYVRSGTTWTEQQKLTAADGARDDAFGSVTISGDTAIVGAPGGGGVGANNGASVSQGAAYVFVRSGATWTQQQKLRLPEGASGDGFGADVAMDGDTAIIGALGEDVDQDSDSDEGAAYIFVRSGGLWVRQQRLAGSVKFGAFGGGVAISQGTVFVDTGGDFAHFYARTDGTTPPPICGGAKPLQLLNIATRLRVQTGENVLIGGLIVTGSDPKRVIIRAIGPSLSGVFAGALSDPVLELRQGETLLARNENWKDSQQVEIEGTGIPPNHELESAIVQTLAPGSYTAVMSGHDGGTGIGVIEVYDLDQAADSKLANIASRGFVEAGDNVIIGGLIVGGTGSTDARVLLRAIGPSLRSAGIADALADPTLELRNANGEILRENDDWQQSQQAEIEATTIPPSDPAESALIAILPAGNYTAVVRGKGDTTGVGLVEVYNLP